MYFAEKNHYVSYIVQSKITIKIQQYEPLKLMLEINAIYAIVKLDVYVITN